MNPHVELYAADYLDDPIGRALAIEDQTLQAAIRHWHTLMPRRATGHQARVWLAEGEQLMQERARVTALARHCGYLTAGS